MSNVIGIINLKGGVGKTTITVGLAEFLVVEKQYKVLVIDLDPQTNSTVSLIGEDEWAMRNRTNRTLYHLFKDQIDDTCTFELEKSVLKRCSNLYGGLSQLHLLPSSLDFVQIQDRLINIGQTALIRPIDVLKRSINDYIKNYDFVLIDCPPNLGIVTQNGLNICDYYLIPTIPDHLSTYGIPQIISSVNSFNRRTESDVKALGIIASMYRANVTRHQITLKKLQSKATAGELPRLFETKIPLASKAADATHFEAEGVNTLKQKYGSSGSNLYEAFSQLTEEFCRYVGL
ncbi:AAA family ATPase [Bacillus sp. sid0103]|uniref:ParA family protein n=1 Tax=Bacillus sp. sid0103 TaxID=2856337 RepID=UPI001C48068C|nr:AAA family ATPase [Bacillus sp. sid0103]MBV7504824.1 AAA family ATPase [Bacillus sp. sid0103]